MNNVQLIVMTHGNEAQPRVCIGCLPWGYVSPEPFKGFSIEVSHIEFELRDIWKKPCLAGHQRWLVNRPGNRGGYLV